MQGTMKYMNVQQQQQYTALRYVVFFLHHCPPCCTTHLCLYLLTMLYVIHICTVYMYIYLHIYCIYISILGFCSIVIQVFVYAGHGDFRTIEQSWWVFLYFPLLVRTNSTFVIQTNTSSRDLEKERKTKAKG